MEIIFDENKIFCFEGLWLRDRSCDSIIYSIKAL